MEMDGDGRILKLQWGGRDDAAPGFDNDNTTRERGEQRRLVREEQGLGATFIGWRGKRRGRS
jgi:hypothetical protein